MNYKGVIIEESLENKNILKDITVLETKVEQVTEKHKTPHLKRWTLHTVEVLEDRGEEVAQKLSENLDSQHAWYADFKNEKFHYIIFRNKIFKIDRGNPEEYRKVVEYGLLLDIPDHQLDFSPDLEEWKRD